MMDEDGEKDGETEPSTEKESIGTGKESKVKAAVAGELKKDDDDPYAENYTLEEKQGACVFIFVGALNVFAYLGRVGLCLFACLRMSVIYITTMCFAPRSSKSLNLERIDSSLFPRQREQSRRRISINAMRMRYGNHLAKPRMCQIRPLRPAASLLARRAARCARATDLRLLQYECLLI